MLMKNPYSDIQIGKVATFCRWCEQTQPSAVQFYQDTVHQNLSKSVDILQFFEN